MSPAGSRCPLLMAVLLCLWVPTESFAHGRVTESCSSLEPGHRVSGQNTPSPYKLTVNTTVYSPGDQILVTLSGSSPFVGFLLQARDSASQDETSVAGTFTLTDPTRTQLLTCNHIEGSAVSHTSNVQQEEVTVIWTVPLDSVNQVQFFVTVIQSFSEFWVKVPGPVVHDVNYTPNATLPVTPTPSSHTTTPSILPGPFTSEGCGQSKSCLLDPPGCDPVEDPRCFFLSVTEESPMSMMFELSGPADGYVSFALSLDSWMGNDDVYLCVREGERVFVGAAVAHGRTVPEGETQVGLSLVSWRLADEVIQCRFSRPVVLDNQEARFDLDRPYFLFLASGNTESGRLLKHKQQPLISTRSKLITGPPEVLRGSRSPLIMKMHGVLMMVAWMVTGSVGTFIASFYKNDWQNKTLLGQKIWFQLHRGLMMLTVALTVAAYCLPFIYRRGWSTNAGSHPALGQTVLIFSLIQPIVAAFRPPPDTPRRDIFNIFHFGLGLTTEILAVVTIFQGMYQSSLLLPQPLATFVMIGYTVWMPLFRAVFQVHKLCCSLNSWTQSDQSERRISVKTVLLAVFALGNISFLSVLLYFVANV